MINFAFTLIVLFWNRKQITIGTIVTMVLISLFVDWIGSITTIMDAIRSSKIYNTYLRKSIRWSWNWSLRLYKPLCSASRSFRFNGCREEKWTFRRTEISLAFLFLTLSFLLDGPIYFGTIILSLQQAGLSKHLFKLVRRF